MSLRSTQATDAVLQALCGLTYDIADALQALGNESKNPGQPIRTHVLRYALSTLPPKRLFPNLPPTVGNVVSGLLGVTRRVTQSDLADFADVSARSIAQSSRALQIGGALAGNPLLGIADALEQQGAVVLVGLDVLGSSSRRPVTRELSVAVVGLVRDDEHRDVTSMEDLFGNTAQETPTEPGQSLSSDDE